MASCEVSQKSKRLAVGMAQIQYGDESTEMGAILGSCVGGAIYDPATKRGAMAHVVLPKSKGKDGPPGKFADTAIVEMINELQKRGARRPTMVAKVVGGASMFKGKTGPLLIGEANREAVLEELEREKIKIVGEDFGGEMGRRINMFCSDGSLKVEIVGRATLVL